ncbi:FAD-dependent oxidoreductase [Rhizobium leguminosarum]|uniref:FAD-dependent oxidoreductase n=1 Tax=Rhizobium leguminosarum TaxID=384 RepID=UPI003F981ADD
MSESHNIVIVGGGIGGLTLARILQTHGLDVTVFEQEASRDLRGQGGSLDMHVESGQLALKEAGLKAEFRAIARPEGQGLRIVDKTGKFHWNESGAEETFQRPEVDRGVLRDLLLDSLKPDTIRWKHKLNLAEPIEKGRYLIHFENGECVRAGVLVGADGAWSRVRPLLTDATPVHTGVNFVEAGIPDAEQTHPALATMVGHGNFMALSDNKGLLAQRNGDGRIRVYVAFRTTEDGLQKSGIPFERPEEARRALLSCFSDWVPELTGLIRACDDSFLPRPINMLPIGLNWESKPGVTLIGDAAHLMSPFAGEGANLAMLDAAELAKAMLATDNSVDAIKAYETTMFLRAERAAKESAENLELCFTPDGAERLARQMTTLHQREGHRNAEEQD